MTVCTRCANTGFLNADQLPDALCDLGTDRVLEWIAENSEHDVQVCDCCGDGGHWYGLAGEHYSSNDPPGEFGPYAYNGGLCECN